MSILRCEMCSALIDSDKDPECVVPDFWNHPEDRDGTLCPVCRALHTENTVDA